MSTAYGAGLNSNTGFGTAGFVGAMSAALDTRVGGPSETRVMRALMNSDFKTLSRGERDALLGLTEALAGDGDIDPADAAKIISLVESYSSNGIDSLRGSWPFPLYDLGRFPGTLQFGGLLGALVDLVVQKAQDTVFQAAVSGQVDQARGDYCSKLITEAFDSIDVGLLSLSERNELLGLLAVAGSDGQFDAAETRAVLQHLNAATEGGCQAQLDALDSQSNPWSYQMTGNGTAMIDLGNGYDLILDEKSSRLTLINQETGEKTIIWGDPHFDGNGDGQTDMDFWGTMTLNLEDGTKITINTTPWNGNTAMTLSSELTITKGDQAMVVTGLDQNQVGDLNISQASGREVGTATDWTTQDGLNIYENPNGEGWLVQDGLGFRAVTQADMNTTRNDLTGTSFDLLPSLFAMSGLFMSASLAAMFVPAAEGNNG